MVQFAVSFLSKSVQTKFKKSEIQHSAASNVGKKKSRSRFSNNRVDLSSSVRNLNDSITVVGDRNAS